MGASGDNYQCELITEGNSTAEREIKSIGPIDVDIAVCRVKPWGAST